MPWRSESLAGQRQEFCEEALKRAVPFSVLARRYGVSPKTGYKWLDRYLVEGPEGLVDRSRAPNTSPNRTDPVMESLVCDLRKEHPRWGGRKLRRVLLNRGHVDVPYPSTITDILRRNDLLEPAPSQAGGWNRFEAGRPNEMWQMDFKGWFLTGTGRCEPFDVLDDHSRFCLTLRAGSDQQEPTVRAYMTEVFGQYGLPDKILCDNGPPWANTQDHAEWTRFGVWLIDLGVGMVFARPRHPQTIGKDERFHRTYQLEVLSTRPTWDSHQQVQAAFDRWRHIYNHERPHDAIDLDVPASRYQQSPRSMPAVVPAVDYPDGYHVRKVAINSQISFQGRRIRIGTAFRGRWVGIVPTTTNGLFEVYYRHQYIRTITMK